MVTVTGISSIYSSVRLLRFCPCLIQKISFWTFTGLNNRYTTSWLSFAVTKPSRKMDEVYFLKFVDYSALTNQSWPSREDIQINKRIVSLKTVEEQLELFESVKSSSNIVNRVTALVNIVKITERSEKQKEALKQEREKPQRGKSSMYMKLLESISKDISSCDAQGLANVLWALGKLKEKDHRLVPVCQNEIMSRDIKAFNNANICQIVNGCVNLNLTSSDIFSNILDAILNGQVKIQHFDNRGFSGILMSYAKVENCPVKLLNIFLDKILSKDFVSIDSGSLAAFVWSFAKKTFFPKELFHQVEKEILRRGTADMKHEEITQILWAFGTAEKGSRELFNLLDMGLTSRGVGKLDNAALLEIVWCFAKKNATKAKVFDFVKKEVLKRGPHVFQNHELVHILRAFVSAQRHDDRLVAEIERELCLKDVKQYDTGQLCQIAWSLGRARNYGSKMFDAIEAESLHRGVTVFSLKQKCMLMRGFIEAKRGTTKFCESLVNSFSTDDLHKLNREGICESAWCFSNAGVPVESLFRALEEEILAKRRSYFTKKNLDSLKKSFRKVGKGSKALFAL